MVTFTINCHNNHYIVVNFTTSFLQCLVYVIKGLPPQVHVVVMNKGINILPIILKRIPAHFGQPKSDLQGGEKVF